MARKLDYSKLPAYDVWDFDKLLRTAKSASRYDGAITVTWMDEAVDSACLTKNPHKALDQYAKQAEEINTWFETIKSQRWYDEKVYWNGIQPRKCKTLE
tara:strand:+ start:174 stop:470 length:297 start_codon:yes stop_codon:yes gene_type:complete